MKFLRYHHRWAWGGTKIEFELLGDNIDDDEIIEVCDELTNEYSYSDKYRGIEYDVIKISDLTVEEKASLIEEYEYKIEHLINSVEYYKKVKEMLQ